MKKNLKEKKEPLLNPGETFQANNGQYKGAEVSIPLEFLRNTMKVNMADAE